MIKLRYLKQFIVVTFFSPQLKRKFSIYHKFYLNHMIYQWLKKFQDIKLEQRMNTYNWLRLAVARWLHKSVDLQKEVTWELFGGEGVEQLQSLSERWLARRQVRPCSSPPPSLSHSTLQTLKVNILCCKLNKNPVIILICVQLHLGNIEVCFNAVKQICC